MTDLNEKQRQQEEEYFFPYHYLDMMCDEYKLIKSMAQLSEIRMIKEIIQPVENKTILDAGCGDARFFYEFKDEKVNLVGVDYSKRAIDFAKAFNPKAEFFVQDLLSLDLPYRFDFIITMQTLEHIEPNKLPKVFDNFIKHMNKNGKLIVAVPSINRPHKDKHYQEFEEHSLRKTLEAKFKVEKIIGMAKKGGMYLFWARVGQLLMPFRHHLGVRLYYGFLRRYYSRHSETCAPKKATRLIAICAKRK